MGRGSCPEILDRTVLMLNQRRTEITNESQAVEQSDVAAEPDSLQALVADSMEMSDEELKGVAGGPWILPGEP